MLGGIAVPHERGLGGHSDADVLTHAVCEALLGALALGDLGRMFPDTDPRWKGVSSLVLLEGVLDGSARAARDARQRGRHGDLPGAAARPAPARHGRAPGEDHGRRDRIA